MARFEAAILADKLIRRATRELMWTSLKTDDGKPTGYGLGWGTADKFGVHIVAHTGGQQGASTAFALVSERRAGVVVLANMDSVNSGGLAEEILKIVLDLHEAESKN
jgi:CubicO group peptidase (beta-lactamase class C family)